MDVQLIEYTGRPDPWRAAEVMIWTKRTRVEMSPGGLEEITAWSEEEKRLDLAYMAATVQSSWEFCDYTFLISQVTRAFTHQLVRTRFGVSYAQQAMQVLDVSQGEGWAALAGPTILRGSSRWSAYQDTLKVIDATYKFLIADGAKVEDARGLLPTNILTNIVMKINLRTLCDLMRKRTSPRNQGEFVEVLKLMKERIFAVHPWAHMFIERTADVVAAELYALLPKIEDKLLRTQINKLVDQLLTNVGGGEQEGL